jgi:ATP-dependent Clp protease ATP-binding subunit ClpA
MLSQEVEEVVERALNAAHEHRHEFATVEHLCLALFNSTRIKLLLKQLGVNKNELLKRFNNFIEKNIEILPLDSPLETLPSLGFQRVIERAALQVASAGREKVGTEHVLVAAFGEEESYAVYFMQEAGITRLDLVSMISHEDFAHENEDFEDNDDPEAVFHEESVLARFALNLTEEARQGRLDIIVGREAELERMMQVLSRRQKNNPLLVGEPGVGKSALAEGLACKIIAQEVPAYLQNCEIYLIDMGALLAGARFRGDFENRLKSLLHALEEQPHAIMVIDEIHTIIGAGATSGSNMDAANLLKPILSKGKLRCIGSTTFKEYRTYFEKDRALLRRFQKIDIDEPSEKECIEILTGIKKLYEKFHDVEISDEAIERAVSLSARFLHERKLPDKAIDLIDEACARLRLKNARQVLAPLLKVDALAIEEAVASMAHIPSQTVSSDDKTLIIGLEQVLKSRIFGQDKALEQVSSAIMLSRAGLRERDKPIGSFLFTGPSGVGKTEVAKQLAKALGINLIRFDMSEYMERHAASRLVGAPPGYVGFEQGGLLTDALNKTPYAVLLLDEIEKAHPDVFNMLLQIMDYGKLTDSNGRQADFRHAILIMTSNVGARELEQKSIGFVGESRLGAYDNAIKNLFAPEFRNRLDARIAFNKLAPENIIQVVHKFIDELASQLSDKNVKILVSDAAFEYLAKRGFDPAMGARPLARLIEDLIKKPLAQELLFGHLTQGGTVKIDKINTEDNLFFEYINTK